MSYKVHYGSISSPYNVSDGSFIEIIYWEDWRRIPGSADSGVHRCCRIFRFAFMGWEWMPSWRILYSPWRLIM